MVHAQHAQHDVSMDDAHTEACPARSHQLSSPSIRALLGAPACLDQGLSSRIEGPGFRPAYLGLHACQKLLALQGVEAEHQKRQPGSRCRPAHHTASVAWGSWALQAMKGMGFKSHAFVSAPRPGGLEFESRMRQRDGPCRAQRGSEASKAVDPKGDYLTTSLHAERR